MCDKSDQGRLPHQFLPIWQAGFSVGSLLDTEETMSNAEDDAALFGYSGGERALFLRAWYEGRRVREGEQQQSCAT